MSAMKLAPIDYTDGELEFSEDYEIGLDRKFIC